MTQGHARSSETGTGWTAAGGPGSTGYLRTLIGAFASFC
ncbi:hypothetical protein LA76x_4609 [Lysobacter antibioticus]|uniref:Uncharacterized protein n=1 Tax=Lysobacter antibioticus TaxID=84531 RepID=A0A0S2FGQ6_LYSAN|nr:hypothetical protein LA76x_4609 [Lysobacter antibioticus]